MFQLTIEFPLMQAQNINAFDSFHRALAPVLLFVQLSGIMSFSGVTSSNLNDIVLKVKSFRFAYSIFTITSICFEGFTSLLTQGKLTLSSVDNILFRFSTMFTTYQFFVLARRWPNFIRSWTTQEQVFLGEKYPIPGLKLKMKVAIVASLIFAPAIGISLRQTPSF